MKYLQGNNTVTDKNNEGQGSMKEYTTVAKLIASKTILKDLKKYWL